MIQCNYAIIINLTALHSKVKEMSSDTSELPEGGYSLDATSDSIVGLMDFTLLDHSATEEALHRFCDKANIAKPAAVCVFSEHVQLVKKWLQSGIFVAAVCGGFPIGSSDSTEVIQSIECAEKGGAHEIDIVLEPRQSEAPSGTSEEDLMFLKACRKACGSLTLKVILETPLLTEESTRQQSQLALSAGADFIKSCTGKRGGCSLEAARCMSDELRVFEETSGQKKGIKISGGIQNKEQALKLLAGIFSQYPSLVCSPDGIVSRQDGERIRIGASSLMKSLIPQLYSDTTAQGESSSANVETKEEDINQSSTY